MRPNNFVILFVAIALGGIAAFLARSWLLSHSQASPSGATIVVASQAVPFGMTLSDDNLTEISWGSRSLPDGAFATKEVLLKDGRRAALTSLSKNEPILASRVSAPGRPASLSTTIEDGKRAVTVRVDDVRGVAGFIMPNDHVDVVLIRAERSAQQGSYSNLLLQNIKVIAVDQVASEQKEKPSVAKAVTLEVTPSQAQKVALATEIGTLSLILRQPNETDVVGHNKVTELDLNGGENARQSASSIAPSMPSEPQAQAPQAPAPDLSTVPVYVYRDIRKDAQKYTVKREGHFTREVLDGSH
jgi:pilus assembly protein CpaB